MRNPKVWIGLDSVSLVWYRFESIMKGLDGFEKVWDSFGIGLG